MASYLTLDDIDVAGKTVLVRSDLDSPYSPEDGIMDNPRLREAAKTIRELAEKQAKVVVLGHQGRPGKKNFTRFKAHAELLAKHVGQRVEYVDSLHDSTARQAIQSLGDGEILLLENLRFSAEEMMDAKPDDFAKTHLVRDLAPLADFYVQNAFTNAHRSHASMVGFGELPQVAGRRFAMEVEGIRKAAQHADRPYVMILGGAKIFDYFTLVDKALAEGSVDKILMGGLLVDLGLLAQGYKLGKKEEFLNKTDSLAKQSLMDLLPKVKSYIEQYPDIFVVPTDVAIEVDGKRHEIPVSELPTEHMIYDIGTESANHYAELIKTAKTVYLKGPVGMYENPEFGKGSEIVVKAITSGDAYSLVGGGDSLQVVEQYDSLDNISHVGLAGGATLKLLAGKELPAVVALESKP